MKKIIMLLIAAVSLHTFAQDPAPETTTRCQGLFSVSANKQVRFAPGNLQYQPSTQLCRFAASQTEVLSWTEKCASERYKGWIDLFGWGTALMPTNYSSNPSDYTFCDWGAYCGLPTNGGMMWRTLSMNEWTYLLSKRPNARRLYAVAYVGKVYGLILLPDDWKCPKGVWVKPGPKEDHPNYFSDEKFALLEASGAVFLPCEAKRMGVQAQPSSFCHYWTSQASAKKPGEAHYLLVDAYVPQGRTANKATGLSVRLVQDMQ